MPIRTVDCRGGKQMPDGPESPWANERRWSPGLTEFRPLEEPLFTM